MLGMLLKRTHADRTRPLSEVTSSKGIASSRDHRKEVPVVGWYQVPLVPMLLFTACLATCLSLGQAGY